MGEKLHLGHDQISDASLIKEQVQVQVHCTQNTWTTWSGTIFLMANWNLKFFLYPDSLIKEGETEWTVGMNINITICSQLPD